MTGRISAQGCLGSLDERALALARLLGAFISFHLGGAHTRNSLHTRGVVVRTLARAEQYSMPQIGTIFLPKANGAIECLIQEITATGARLKLAAAHRVPPHFQFASRNGSPRNASVVWWDIEAVGIRFTG